MSVVFGFVFFGLSLFFADEKAAYVAAHDFCPDTFVERIDGQSYFECEGVEYAVACDDGECSVVERTQLASVGER